MEGAAGGREGAAGVDLSALPPALARLVLQRLADEAGGPSIAAHTDAILALQRTGTATLDLPGGLRAISEYGRIRIDHGPPTSPAPTRLPVPGRVKYGAGELTCERGAFALEDGTLAAHALATTLEVRAWRPGDRMRPLGLHGTKSLQDLFTDRKVPRERRAQIPVVVSDGEIAWVPGVATGEPFMRPGHNRATGAAELAPRLRGPMSEEIGEILVQADDLQHRIRAMAEDIARDYEGKDLLLIGVLKGAFLFLADLMRHLDVGCEVDFMAVASYGSATESSGVVRILKDLDAPLEGRHVLIVEDIVDSGLTLQYLLRTLESRGPASLEVCALLTKPSRRTVDLPVRYTGFEIPDKFAIGYGLDYAERYRNLPYVAALVLTDD